MTLRSSFDPRAHAELEEAATYYGRESGALRLRFIHSVEAAVANVESFPGIAASIRGEYRRELVRGFPYGLIYRVRGDEIRVLAVAHSARRPFYWRGRK